ncbi:MAG: cytochrome c biogenesis protein ResB [Prevotellaceae bacterium]|jgi:hypothetical protein|nr:cytochrome c biogenesis protein ResB [Prevotellaceae bacterium]
MKSNKGRVVFGDFPYGYAESLTVAGLITIAGYVLQVIIPSGTAVPSFPANAAIVISAICLIVYLQISAGNHPIILWLSSSSSAVSSCVAFVLQMIIMGLFIQDDQSAGGFFGNVTGSWPFALTFIYLMLVLGLASAKRCRHFRLKNIPFILNHIGLWIALSAGAAGSGDFRETSINLREGETRLVSHIEMRPLRKRFSIHLDSFASEIPASEISIQLEDEKEIRRAKVKVNSPYSVNGLRIYQTGYSSDGLLSELKIVRDPWLPAVYVGIFMMLAGAAFATLKL